MRRFALLVAVVALMPLVMGAGGSNPPPFATKIAGPAFLANIVVDTHNTGVTTTAKLGTIRVYHGSNTAAGIFTVPPSGVPFDAGCDLSKTDTRFLGKALVEWIPEDVVTAVFNNLGITRTAAYEPAITDIVYDECTPDPANPSPSQGAPGILSFQATIKFLVPK